MYYMKFYECAQFSLTLSYHLLDGMDDDYLMSSYSSFFFPCVAPGFIYYKKVKSALKAE